MTTRSPDSTAVTELLPEKKLLPLEGLYLNEGLARMADQRRQPLVLTDYLTDQNGVIAKADAQHHFQVPPETRNASDWRLAQELMAQADVMITGGDYLRRASSRESHRQEVLYQFEPGREFEELGDWRLRTGYKKRSPDLAVVSRHLDFQLPADLRSGGRRLVIFTTDEMADSAQARVLTSSGAVVLGSGKVGVDGERMIDYLSDEMGARVIVMATGPGVLQLLLAAQRLDFLYLTQVQRQIPFEDPSTVKTLRPQGQRVQDLKEFRLARQYLQEDVVAADGSLVSQLFFRFDRS